MSRLCFLLENLKLKATYTVYLMITSVCSAHDETCVHFKWRDNISHEFESLKCLWSRRNAVCLVRLHSSNSQHTDNLAANKNLTLVADCKYKTASKVSLFYEIKHTVYQNSRWIEGDKRLISCNRICFECNPGTCRLQTSFYMYPWKCLGL